MGLHLLRPMLDISRLGRKKTVQEYREERQEKREKPCRVNGIGRKKTGQAEPTFSPARFDSSFRSPLTAGIPSPANQVKYPHFTTCVRGLL